MRAALLESATISRKRHHHGARCGDAAGLTRDPNVHGTDPTVRALCECVGRVSPSGRETDTRTLIALERGPWVEVFSYVDWR